MSRSIFGWSYPPGCNGPPDDYDLPCAICGEFPDNCICPECQECGGVGDPSCYLNHGLRRTEEQKFSLECFERQWREYNEMEKKYWDNLDPDDVWP